MAVMNNQCCHRIIVGGFSVPPSAVPQLGQQGDFLYVDSKNTVEHIKRQHRANKKAVTALYDGSMNIQ